MERVYSISMLWEGTPATTTDDKERQLLNLVLPAWQRPVVWDEQQQVRFSLSGALRGILCQRLVTRSDGRGRCAVMEICVNTGRVADAIADPAKTSSLATLVAEGGYYGMQTFDQHLTALYRDGIVSLDAALAASSNPHDLMVELRRLGLVS